MAGSCHLLQIYGKKVCVTLLESEGKQRVQRGRAAHREVAVPRHASATSRMMCHCLQVE